MKVIPYDKKTGKELSSALLYTLVSFDINGNIESLMDDIGLRFEIDKCDFGSIIIKEEVKN